MSGEYFSPAGILSGNLQFGSFVGDHDGLLPTITDFQAADSRREAVLKAGSAPQAAPAAQDMLNIISATEGHLSRLKSAVSLQ